MDGTPESAAGHSETHSSTSRQAKRPNGSSKRLRVTRACDRCKRRKIRCTGLQPCRLCIGVSAHCTYDAPYTRGKQAVIASRSDGQISPQTRQNYQRGDSTDWPIDTDDQAPVRPWVRQPLPADTEPPAESASRASPEPAQTDLEGHYVGPSSGVSFLLRIQKRLDQFTSFSQGSSIFTFGDVPLPYPNSLNTDAPYFDPSFYLMLSRNDTTRLVQRYFDFAVPVDRFLHRQTIEAWLEEFHETKGKMHKTDDATTRTAVLFMVFAIAQAHMSPRPTSNETDMSGRYFLAANQLLSREQGAVRLASVQARLCQCLWLLSESRINHCYNLFGTAARFAYTIGLHRNKHADRIDRVEIECRRRTFWSAYALDNYLSTALGRPRTFHDEDIDQELPSCADDHYIYPDYVDQNGSNDQPVMLGPIAYAKMSRILSNVLRNIYSIQATSHSTRHSLAITHAKELSDWRAEMSHFLDPVAYTVPLIPIFQRQKNILNLAYWHTMVLTHRPFLLRNFAQLQTAGRQRHGNDDAFEAQMEESVRECLKAACNIVETVNDMHNAGQLFRAYWFTSYFAFSAAVILYVYTIQKSSGFEKPHNDYFSAATRCQNQLSELAEDGSLLARYCIVLQELRLQALEQTRQLRVHPRIPDHSQELIPLSSAASTDPFAAANSHTTCSSDFGNATMPDIYADPTDSLAETTTGWAQFDALVSASVDNLQLNL